VADEWFDAIRKVVVDLGSDVWPVSARLVTGLGLDAVLY
jgi:hypothetical protein